MSTLLQPGHHPDAEQLSAFAEHALPQHEQKQMLAHLAGCADCRALVYLAQDASAQEGALAQQATRSATARDDLRGWMQLKNWPWGWRLALPVTALACLVLLTVHLRNAPAPQSQSNPRTVALNEHQQPLLPAAPIKPLIAPASPTIAPRRSNAAAGEKRLNPVETGRWTAGAVASSVAPTAAVASIAAPVAPAAAAPPMQRAAEAFVGNGGVQGTITDAAGLAVARARVTATNTDTGVQQTRQTNAAGNYAIVPLQPGSYNVEIVAPGFKRLLQENVTVDATSVQRVNEPLAAGGADTTVTVTDAPPFLDASNATIGGTIVNQLYSQLPISMNGGPRDPTAFQYVAPGQQANPANNTGAGANNGNSGIYGGTGQTNLNQNYINGVPVANASGQGVNAPAAAAANAGAAVGAADRFEVSAGAARLARTKPLPVLPSKLPTLSVVEYASLTLAIDSAGALFRSDDAGVTWHAVEAQWQGRALGLRLTQPLPATLQGAAVGNANATASTAASAATNADATSAGAMQLAKAAAPAFELTTDSGVVYTSADGQTWRRK